MRKTLGTATLAAVLLTPIVSLSQAANFVAWRTIIGIAQAGNVVGGITGAGQPWSTREGEVLADPVRPARPSLILRLCH